MNAIEMFLDYVAKMDCPKVLELGTLRSKPDRSTMHKSFVPNASEYHGTDIVYGLDVDFVADVHKLSETAGKESYDVIISCSSFEHFKYPHLAAFEISRTLKTNGALFIQTHCCFPLHAYPYDYFRFSTEALNGCFGKKNGVNIQMTNYEFPCAITAADVGMSSVSYLNCNLFGIKSMKTPPSYIYEFDTTL
jgi:hypothetical protein